MLSSEPRLEIGVASGEEPYLLSNVRDTLLSPDGFLVVADGGTNEIRVFDSDGSFVRSMGGRGEGPEEFQAIGWIRYREGRILVHDLVTRRITEFAFSGDFLGSRTPQGAAQWGFTTWVGPFSDGSLLARIRNRESSSPPAGPRSYSETSFTGTYVHVHGASFDTLGTYPAGTQFSISIDGISGGGSAWLKPQIVEAVGDEFGIFGTTHDTALVVYRPASGELGTLISGEPYRAMTEADWEAHRLRRTEGREAEANVMTNAIWEEAFLPSSHPIFDEAIIDDRDRIWLRTYAYRAESRRWIVFDPDGLRMAEVMIPSDIDVLQVTENEVVAVREDDLGIERVGVWGIVR